MKKYLSILVGFMLFCSVLNAQYSINKTKYDYRTYIYKVGDPYNPPIAGVVSWLVPGLGQMISGEGGRGAAFLGGYVGCWVIYGVGSAQAIIALEDDLYGDEYSGEGLAAMAIGIIGAVTVNIWSIVDATRVAKVNNLAWRDQNATGYNIQIRPHIDMYQYANMNKSQVGLSIKLSF